MQLLIEKGAAIDATDKDGWTPLHAACRQGNTNVVLLLVNAKASIVCRSRVRPATHNFTQSDGARSDNLFGQAGKLPREYAVAQGCDKIVELLDAASEGGDLSQFRRDDGAGPNGGQPGSSPQASANAGVTSGPNPKLSAEVKRVEGNDESLEEINWTGQPGVDMSALCALADALPANMHVRRIILKDVKALTDPIGTRIGASLPYCAVQVIHVDGSNLSPGKIEELNSLCLMNDVRQVAANLPRLSGVLWKGRHATDKTVAALAENLRGNTQVLIIDLSYVSPLRLSHNSQVFYLSLKPGLRSQNPQVHDESVLRLAAALPQSGVRELQVTGTAVSPQATAELQKVCAANNIQLDGKMCKPEPSASAWGMPPQLQPSPGGLTPRGLPPPQQQQQAGQQLASSLQSLSLNSSANPFQPTSNPPAPAPAPAPSPIAKPRKSKPADSRLFGWVAAGTEDKAEPAADTATLPFGFSRSGDADGSDSPSAARDLWGPTPTNQDTNQPSM